jgi:hypothetical protein
MGLLDKAARRSQAQNGRGLLKRAMGAHGIPSGEGLLKRAIGAHGIPSGEAASRISSSAELQKKNFPPAIRRAA